MDLWIPGCGCPVLAEQSAMVVHGSGQIEGVWLRSGSFLLYNQLMDTTTSENPPAYLYTPHMSRAFLSICADVQGKFSAGYMEWLENPELEIVGYRVYGPITKAFDTPNQARAAMNVEYRAWREDNQGGLHSGRSASA